MRTIVETNREVFVDNRTATRAFFTGIAGINLQEQSTSICRFVGCELCELAPSNVTGTLVSWNRQEVKPEGTLERKSSTQR